MINLLNYFLEANFVLLLFALVYYTLLKDQPNFQLRRAFILTGMVCALLLPFISLGIDQGATAQNLFPKGMATITLPELVVGGGAEGSSAPVWQLHWSSYLIWCYGLVSLVFTLFFFKQLWSIWQMVSHVSVKRYRHKGCVLVETNGNYPTFSFFKFLILGQNCDLNTMERDQIIWHEQVHIRQWHSIDIVLLEILKVLFWINPAVWFLRKTQAENHEFIADELTLEHYDRSQYQQLLVKMTVGQMQLVGNYFAKIQTLKRINMMNEKREKPNWVKTVTALAACGLIAAVFACNDELVEIVHSAEMVVELPPSAQMVMTKLKKAHPDEKFVYVEIDDFDTQDQNGKGLAEALEMNGINKNKVRFVGGVKERAKLGLILSNTENFHKIAEFTKDMSLEGEEVFDIVEEQPAPVGGMKEFYSYVAHNLRYPTTARQKGIEGRVFIQFVVDSEGNLTKIKTVKGVGAGCDEEAVRVLEGAPNWKPGKQRGRAVNVRMILPITFKIDKPKESAQNYNSKRLGKIETPQMEEIVVVGFQGK
ncbi:MAG: M56 family metallopeptidase [Cyclobacteriaceae bacterium]